MDGHIDNYKNTATPATPEGNPPGSWADGFDLLAETREAARARKLAERVAKVTQQRPSLADEIPGLDPDFNPNPGPNPGPAPVHDIQQLPPLILPPATTLGPEWVINRLVYLVDQCMTIRPVYPKRVNPLSTLQPTDKYTFDAAGAQKALNILARTQGMFTDKIEIKGSLETASVAEIDNRIRELLTAFPELLKYVSIEHEPDG